MNIDRVKALHEELSYSDTDRQALQGVKLVWRKLERLRQDAEREERHLRPYREFLSNSLQKVRYSVVESDEEITTQRVQDFWAWFNDQYQRYGIPARVSQRVPGPFLEWSERWCQQEYAMFMSACSAMYATPSASRVDDAKRATEELIKAYLGAVPSS